ncbi:MAG: S-layer homology domain-containing protein [Kurthia sp.]|nr:S-layer homology domain-containing protein [Candidatus Kurthia equi]
MNEITFKDAAKISEFAKYEVGLLEHLDIIHGTDKRTFEPQSYLIRAQMANMLTGTLKITGDM